MVGNNLTMAFFYLSLALCLQKRTQLEYSFQYNIVNND